MAGRNARRPFAAWRAAHRSGSNGHIAWAFTNLTADLSDLVLLERDPADPNRYLVPGGSEPFIVEEVRIGAPPGDEALTIRSTRYGPIVDEQPNGNPIALHWVFFEPHALDVRLFDIAAAQTLDDALKAARDWHGPPQNTLVASKDGRIGWTIAGSLPARDAATPAPVSWRDAPAWHGVLASEKKPILVDPASGVLTSANQLSIVPEGALASVLGSNEAPGDRASRLRTLITARSDWTELELHKVQLDVYSARLVRWRDALLAALPTTPELAPSLAQDPPQDSPHANDAAHAARALLVSWNGQVDADAAAPEIIDACRREVRAAMGGAIGSGAADGIDDEALLRMLESRAPHLLPAPTGGWSAFIARVLASAATATRLPHADTKVVAKSAAKVVAKMARARLHPPMRRSSPFSFAPVARRTSARFAIRPPTPSARRQVGRDAARATAGPSDLRARADADLRRQRALGHFTRASERWRVGHALRTSGHAYFAALPRSSSVLATGRAVSAASGRDQASGGTHQCARAAKVEPEPLKSAVKR